QFRPRGAAKDEARRYHAGKRGQRGVRKERAMAGRLKGKVALVTASGQGIGRAITEAFIADGAKVIATDVDDKKLKGLKAALRTKLDVRSDDAIAALAKSVKKEFGALDV